VFDDTDCATLENVSCVYRLLNDLGMKTTKSVWPIRGTREPQIGGSTCDDPDYLEWLCNLQNQGFEIAFHNATYHSSFRDETARGLTQFMQHFGHYPHTMSNHMNCAESLYWGANRLTGVHRALYKLLPHRHANDFRGHIEQDPLFWGDYCRDSIKFVRNFVYENINTLKACPYMPYHDPERAFVNYWFASSDGANVRQFNKCISERNQDRLQEECGACIMYTHFASGFQERSGINSRFEFLMRRLSKLDGWFVTVSDLLNYMLDQKQECVISSEQRSELERRWFLSRIRSSLRYPWNTNNDTPGSAQYLTDRRTV
jgi:hypothetical protein